MSHQGPAPVFFVPTPEPLDTPVDIPSLGLLTGGVSMKVNQFVAAAFAAVLLSGCATVINGTSQDIKFDSNAKQTTVKISTGITCVAPCKLDMKRRRDFRVDFAAPGYRSAYVLVQSRTGGAVAGNVLLGGLIGGVVDGANGSTNHLYPNPVKVRLIKDGEAGEPELLTKKGKVISTIAAHNDKVRGDLNESLGKDLVGEPGTWEPVAPAAPAAPAAAPVAAPAAATPAAPAAPAAAPAAEATVAAPATPAEPPKS